MSLIPVANLPPASLLPAANLLPVSLIPVANLPPVSLIPVVKFETVLMDYSGAGGKLIHQKTISKKSRDTVPLNRLEW